MIPIFMPSSARAISSKLRLPFSMSVSDIHGLAFWSTRESDSLRASAARLLRTPDQLMKTLSVSAIVGVTAVHASVSYTSFTSRVVTVSRRRRLWDGPRGGLREYGAKVSGCPGGYDSLWASNPDVACHPSIFPSPCGLG